MAAAISNHRRIRKLKLQLLSWLLRSRRPGPIPFVTQFSYKDIRRATDGFNRVIYSNSQIAAYKARFHNGEVALVKEVGTYSEDNGDVFFCKQVQLLGRLHHRHLLGLKGFSMERKRFLVYDNIENGSLKGHLNDPLKTPLDWRTRLQIAIGVAAALEYLFLFTDPPVYHVAISSSSIMLDEDFTAKLSDVGLLSFSGTGITDPNTTSVSEDYLGKEYGNIIFQLGMLILELITGQSSEKGGGDDLIHWIQDSGFNRSMSKMLDPDLGNGYDSTELKILLAVAKLCINSKSRNKSLYSVLQILRFLQRKVDIPHN